MSRCSTWPTASTRSSGCSSIDTGRLPQETHDLSSSSESAIRACASSFSRPTACSCERLVDRHGPEPVPPVGRATAPLLQRPQGAAAEPRAWHGLDCWVTGPSSRPVGVADEHPQGRDRPRPRRHRQAQPARRVDATRRSGTTSATTTCPRTPCTRRVHVDRLRPCTRAIAPGEPTRAGRWWWETGAPKECGIHCSIETGGFEHELHAILGEEAHA